MSSQLYLTKRYMPGLDGLRTLAVFFVVLYHLNVNWAPGGLLGVSIFFVLSGYLITDLLTAEWGRTRTLDLKSFWIRRCRRLMPAMMVMMVSVASWVTIFNPSLMHVLRGDAVSSLLYVNNWYLIFHQVSYFEKFGPVSPLGHMWSLAVEEQFYLLWPLLLLLAMKLLRKRGPIFLFILAAAGISSLLMLLMYDPDHDPSRVYYGTDTRAFSLLIGAALSIVWPSRKLSAAKSFTSRLMLEGTGIVGLGSVFYMVWNTNEYDGFLYPGGFILLSVLAAMVIASAAHPASLVGRLLGIKPLRWLGVRSYSIYIWHYPVIVLTAPADLDPSVWRAILQSTASIVLAALSYKYIEEPIRGGLIGRMWNKFRKGNVNLSLVPLKGWITFASVLALVIVSCTGFAMRTPVSASVLPQEAAPVTAVVTPPDPNGEAVDPPPTMKPPADKESSIGTPTAPARDDEAHAAATPSPHSEQGAGEVSASHDKASGSVDSASADTGKAKQTEQHKPQDAAANDRQSGQDRSQEKQNKASSAAKPDKKPVPVTAIGDSVMLDAEPYLQKLIPGAVIDGKIGRQMAEAPKLVERLRAEGKLGDQLVIELGTNGPFSSKQLMSLLDSLQDVRRIVLVNARVPRGWESTVNASIQKAASAYSNTVLLDWHAASKGKSYFEPDGVHLKPQGGKMLAEMMAQALGYPSK